MLLNPEARFCEPLADAIATERYPSEFVEPTPPEPTTPVQLPIMRDEPDDRASKKLELMLLLLRYRTEVVDPIVPSAVPSAAVETPYGELDWLG